MKRFILAALAVCAATGLALAQTGGAPFSDRPITVVLAFPPGASADTNMRLITQKVTAQTGQTFIIKNAVGGAGVIAVSTVKRAPPDGLTLLQATLTTMATNQYLAEDKPYDLVKDFRPVTKMWSFPLLLVTSAKSDVKTVGDLVALAKRKPGGLSYSSTGVHSVPHFLGALLAAESAAPMVHVPYSSAAAGIYDVIAGRLDFYFISYASVRSFIEAGELRALAVAESKRMAALPDTPTTGEAGYPGVVLPAHWGLLAPAGVPDAAITRLNEMFVNALRDPGILRIAAREGTEIAPTTPAAFGDMVSAEFKNLERLLKTTGMERK